MDIEQKPQTASESMEKASSSKTAPLVSTADFLGPGAVHESDTCWRIMSFVSCGTTADSTIQVAVNQLRIGFIETQTGTIEPI